MPEAKKQIDKFREAACELERDEGKTTFDEKMNHLRKRLNADQRTIENDVASMSQDDKMLRGLDVVANEAKSKR